MNKFRIQLHTILLLGLGVLFTATNSTLTMKETAKAPALEEPAPCFVTPNNRLASVKDRCAKILMDRLLAGTMDAETAENTWAPDIKDLIKCQLIYKYLLLFMSTSPSQTIPIDDEGEEIAITPDGRYILTVSEKNLEYCVKLYDRYDQSPSPTILVRHVFGAHRKAAISEDGLYVLSTAPSTIDEHAQYIDLTQQPPKIKLLTGLTSPITCLALRPDGKYALTGSDEPVARLWDLQKDIPTCITLEGHTTNISCVALTPDGRYALTGSFDGTARLWDLLAKPITSTVIKKNMVSEFE